MEAFVNIQKRVERKKISLFEAYFFFLKTKWAATRYPGEYKSLGLKKYPPFKYLFFLNAQYTRIYRKNA